MICVKVLEMYSDLLKKDPSLIFEGSDFKASRGWFENFKWFKWGGIKIRQDCSRKIQDQLCQFR